MSGSRETLEREEELADELDAAVLERARWLADATRVGPTHPRRLIRTHDWTQNDDQEDDER